MKYLMLVCIDPDFKPGQDEGAPDVDDWVTQMDGKGIRLMGSRTRPAYVVSGRSRYGQA